MSKLKLSPIGKFNKLDLEFGIALLYVSISIHNLHIKLAYLANHIWNLEFAINMFDLKFQF
jgi:hypothetical protein